MGDGEKKVTGERETGTYSVAVRSGMDKMKTTSPF
jgi:hypothetical protein